jgi:uncharacterized protein (DUF983 family)
MWFGFFYSFAFIGGVKEVAAPVRSADPPVPFSAVGPLRAALACRCPRCGKGPLFSGLLGVRPACEVCGLDLSAQDAGDGPAVFAILFLGALVVGLAALVEIKFSPPVWVHLLLWGPLIVIGAVAMLRPLKAGLIALQYRHRRLSISPPS